MKLSLTRGQIITEALETAGRPDLVSNARLWLSMFLEEFYMNQDVEWLVKSATLSVANALAFPTDYRASKSALIVRYSEEFNAVITSDSAKYDQYRKQNTDASGVPNFVFADHDLRQFFFVPSPTTGLELELKYYYIPTIDDHTDPLSDDEIPKWEMPSSILIEYLKGMVHEYNDDERQGIADQKVMSKVTAAKVNNRDVRAGSSRMAMGKSFRKR